ncbi:MAG: recombination protein RecR [Erysipelothrix sp.]|nr:recombination protein RecR [Erysipelothrix sp.]
MYPKSLQQLIEEFKKLPGVGNKTAERYALKVLEWDIEKIKSFSSQIIKTKEAIQFCSNCGNFSEESLCTICKDKERDHSIIMVVSSPRDILAIERLNEFKGLYHVTGGLISPLNHIMPEDLEIDSLVEKAQHNLKEVILALNSTMEGETTSLYIARKLKDKVLVSHLAQGLPMGGQLEYTDELTLLRSLDNRKKIEV